MNEFKTINDILDFAIQAEQEAVEFYTALAGLTKDDHIKEVYLYFAKEEIGHKSKLLEIKTQGNFNLGNTQVTDLKMTDYLTDVIAKPNMSYQDALIVAMKKEKAAFKLYMDLADKTNIEEFKQLFYQLAMEESKHKLKFEIEYDEYILREN